MSVPTTPGFLDRRSLITWVTVVLMALGVYWQVTSQTDLWSDRGGLITAAVFWLAYGIVVGWLIYRLQLFEHRPVSATIAAIAWGAFVAGGIIGWSVRTCNPCSTRCSGSKPAGNGARPSALRSSRRR